MRAALERRAPGRYIVAYGAKHAAPLIEEAAAALTGAGVARVIGLVLTPHGASMGSQEYLDRAETAHRRHVPLRRRAPLVRRTGPGRAAGGAGDRRPRRPGGGAATTSAATR